MKKTILTAITVLSLLSLSSTAAEWENSFDLGATVTKGNSDATLLTAGLSSELKDDSEEYLINLFYTYGESDSDTTNDDLVANAAWKHTFSEKSYRGARFDFLRDDIADINYRTSLTAVLGKFLVENDSTSVKLESGLGYTFEEQGSISDNYTNLYFGQFYNHKINDKTKIFQSLKMFSPIDSLDNYNFIAELGLETSLTETLSLKISAQNKYDAIPASGRDSNDFRFVTGISYKF
jgi:putative salt-induced outer membrane protein